MCLIASASAAPALAADAPDISESNRHFLSRLVRRALQDSVRGRPIYQPSYVPAAIKETEFDFFIAEALRPHQRAEFPSHRCVHQDEINFTVPCRYLVDKLVE